MDRKNTIPQEWEVSKYLKILKKLKPTLREKFKVVKIGIFGSFVRNEQRKNSDIDIIVKFSEPIGLKMVELVFFLEKELGRKVELVPDEAISPYIKPYVEKEVIYV